jgi:RNA polymerase sigma-70 factor (ECF subfamily)
MVKIPEPGREGVTLSKCGAVRAAPELHDWFVREVLPLEATLRQYLRRSLKDRSNVDDLVHDVYVRVCEAASEKVPHPVQPFVFTVARNLLINRLRREQIVPIEAVEDIDALNVAIESPGPEQIVLAREELRLVQSALDRLPPRSRQAVILRKVEGLSWREIAERMGIAEATVSWHLKDAVRGLTRILYGEGNDLRSKS